MRIEHIHLVAESLSRVVLDIGQNAMNNVWKMSIQDPSTRQTVKMLCTPYGNSVVAEGDCSKLPAGSQYRYELECNGRTFQMGTARVIEKVVK